MVTSPVSLRPTLSVVLPPEPLFPSACRWVQGDAMELPFESSSFDAATMGYGLRNVADRGAALRELHRVLKPGGVDALRRMHCRLRRHSPWAPLLPTACRDVRAASYGLHTCGGRPHGFVPGPAASISVLHVALPSV